MSFNDSLTHTHTLIQKKSRDESKGAGSGVEILINEPYEDGPGGKGQYTRKMYHVGSHLPGWIKGIPPISTEINQIQIYNSTNFVHYHFVVVQIALKSIDL